MLSAGVVKNVSGVYALKFRSVKGRVHNDSSDSARPVGFMAIVDA